MGFALPDYQAALPRKKTLEPRLVRPMGARTVIVTTVTVEGVLPYGSIPRLILAWLITQARELKRREIPLGARFSEYLTQLGYANRGGERGDRDRVRQQLLALGGTVLGYATEHDLGADLQPQRLTERSLFWWDRKDPLSPKRPSLVVVSEEFYEQAVTHGAPVRLDTLRKLARSPLAMDLYVWLTHEYYSLSKPETRSWEYLQQRFGREYAHAGSFRRELRKELAKVRAEYREARWRDRRDALVLLPSPTHVPRRRLKLTS
jgi:hypothetical protein